MRAKLQPQLAPVTHGGPAGVRRTDRAHDRARWATSRTPSKVLANHFGVAPSRVRHFRTDDQRGPLTQLCAALADPNVDAGAVIVALLASFEERFVYAPTDELRARLKHLREVEEHRAQAEQDRALMVRCEKRVDACLQHASVLIEIAVLEGMLGPVEVAH